MDSHLILSWNKVRAAFRFEIVWRTVTFLVAVAVLTVIATHWNRWEGDAEWQSNDDAYLQADLRCRADSGSDRAIQGTRRRLARETLMWQWRFWQSLEQFR